MEIFKKQGYKVDGQKVFFREDQVMEAIKQVEKDTGKKFGAEKNPLLFSCRSGAAISMPGMVRMTTLALGLLT